MLDEVTNVAWYNRRLYELQANPPTQWFAITSNMTSYGSNYLTHWSAAVNATQGGNLPDTVHLQELRYGYSPFQGAENSGLIMQLQHMFTIDESTEWYLIVFLLWVFVFGFLQF